MNRKTVFCICWLLSLTAALCGCIQPIPQESEPRITEETTAPPTQDTKPAETDAKPTYIYQTMNYTYKIDVSGALDAIVTDMSPDYLILINKFIPLDETYEPSQLTRLTCQTYHDKEIELETRTARALYAMLGEMAADGVTDIAVTSGYRTYAYQQQLFKQYLNVEKLKISPEAYAFFGTEYIQSVYLDNGLTSLTEEDAIQVVLSYSALPGTSEHQSGLCVDFVTSTAMLNENFENTEAFDWLSQNAYRFGFILRYPSDKTEITGYSYEPWHFRFVGREAATEIYFGNMTLEEFSAL